MAKFSVVEFKEENLTEVIPSEWMTPKKTRARWPDYKGFKIKRALTGSYDFSDGQWDILLIRLLASSESYEKARKKARKAEDTFCLETTDDERHVRRKKKKHARKDSYSSCDEVSRCEEDIFSATDFPSASQSVISSDGQVPMLNDKLKEPESCSNSEIIETRHHKCCEKKLIEKTFKILEDLMYEVKRLRSEIQNLQRPKISVEQEDGEGPTEFFFPIRNLEELDIMEALANVPETRMKIMKFLSRVGGLTYKDLTYNIMSRLLTPEVAVRYSFCGKKGKLPFRSLALCQAVISAVMTSAKESTQTDVERRIGTFLATAKDRNGGRKARDVKNGQILFISEDIQEVIPSVIE